MYAFNCVFYMLLNLNIIVKLHDNMLNLCLHGDLKTYKSFVVEARAKNYLTAVVEKCSRVLKDEHIYLLT